MRFKEGYDYLSGDLNSCQTESMKQSRVVQFGCPDNDILNAIIPCSVNGCSTLALVDTGSQVTVINFDLFDKFEVKSKLTGKFLLQGVNENMNTEAWLIQGISISFGSSTYKWDVLVVSVKDQIIIGMDFMCHFGVKLNFMDYTFTLQGEVLEFNHVRSKSNGIFETCRVVIDKKLTVPGNSVMLVEAKTSVSSNNDFVFEPSGDNKGLLIPRTLCRGEMFIPLQVVNDSTNDIVLKSNHVLRHAVECDLVLDDKILRTCVLEAVENSDNSVSNESNLPEHLVGLLERSKVKLSDSETGKVRSLLIQFQDTFSRGGTDLGCFSEIKHCINTGDEPPVKQALRRKPIGFENEEEDNLKLMLETGVITESSSDWASAPVLVRKKDGSVRYCVDYRSLNKKTVKDLFPLPSISQCLDQLSGNMYFSTLDMASGYWQIKVDPRDRHKPAFITKFGLFEHQKMAFGVCNAPATFQRVMQFVLRGLTWTKLLSYLDDVIILGKDFEDHLSNLETTLTRFRKYNLKLKPKKCSLFQTETLFLGRIVSAEGVAVNPENVQKVRDWPVPKSVKDVERFLGFLNYHREHIRGYASSTQILYKLTGSKAKFSWGESEQFAFDSLNEILTSAPILAYPNPSDTFVLDTDASEYAIGAVLSQLQDGIERVICYGSYVLSPEQRKYCVTRKELLAVVRFTRQYRHYLLGREFLLRTDHNSLTWLLRFKYLEGQLARWLEELSQLHMTVLHRPGIKHGNADGLSRIPDEYDFCDCYRAGSDLSTLPCGGCRYCSRAQQQWSRFDEDVDYVVPLTVKSAKVKSTVGKTPWITGYSHDQLVESQRSDPCLGKLLTWLSTGEEPVQKDLFRGRRQRWVSPERSVRDRSPHENREYRRGSEGYDYARNVSRLHSHGDRDYRDQGYSESRFGRDCDYRDQGYNESCFGRDRDYRRDCDYRDRYSDPYGERRYASGRLERFDMRGETTKEEDRKVVSILNDMYDWVKPEIEGEARPFDKALLLQRCMEDLENCRTWRFQSHEVSQESKSSYVRELSVVIPNSPQESKSSRVKEPSPDIPEVSKDTSVKAKVVTSAPEASTVRMEVNQKSDLSDSSAVNRQSSKPVVGSVMYPKKRCFMKGCEMRVTHLRRHLVGRHLPPCSALKDEMPLAMRMTQFNNILLSIANNVGCNNVFDLLEVVRCRRWYPDGEHYFLTDDDVQVMRDFVKWITGKEMRTKPTLNPPNTTGVLTHWRLLGILISRVGEKNVTWYHPDQPSSTEKRKQERDSFAVSVDARQPTEVEIEVDVGDVGSNGLS